MSNSILFKKAHKMARKNIKKGDNYRLTFGLCLKALISEQPMRITTFNNDNTITVSYISKRKVNKHCAMVGDYTKPADKVNDSLETKNMLIASISILIIFVSSLLTIINQ